MRVAGRSSAAERLVPVVEGANVRVGMPDRPLQLVDARPPMSWTTEQVEEAVRSQQHRAGALVALVRERIEAAWDQVRLELNQLAGGQASARVMILAHHAMRAHSALELQTLLAEMAAGGEKREAEASLRTQAGLAVISTEALSKAYEAAREEGKAGNAVTGPAGLLARLGHQAPGVDVGAAHPGSSPTHVPVSTPGVGVVGAPLPSNPSPQKDSE